MKKKAPTVDPAPFLAAYLAASDAFEPYYRRWKAGATFPGEEGLTYIRLRQERDTTEAAWCRAAGYPVTERHY